MGNPRPTRRMYGYFADDDRLPRELRGQNLFYSTEDDYLYCMEAGKAVRRGDADALAQRGLVVHDEQHISVSDRRTLREGRDIRSRGTVILLSVGCFLMLLANIYAWVANR